jgi:hypothetical protein
MDRLEIVLDFENYPKKTDTNASNSKFILSAMKFVIKFIQKHLACLTERHPLQTLYTTDCPIFEDEEHQILPHLPLEQN